MSILFNPQKKKLHFAKAHQEPWQVSPMEALFKGLSMEPKHEAFLIASLMLKE
jgi:hypothetical protein